VHVAQFYLDGYRPGDPFTTEPHPSVAQRSAELPEHTDATDADPEKFQRYFRDQGRFTAGFGVRYAPR
jgi:hypothetical protein